MLKTLAVLLICAASRSESVSKVYFHNFGSGEQTIYNAGSSEIHTDETWENLIRHNIGLIKESESLSEISKKLIDGYGKGSLLQPTMLNYIFLIEGDSLQNNNTQAVNMDVCSDSKSVSECILSRIYGDADSIASDLKKLHGDKDHFSLSYIYSSAPESLSSLQDYVYSTVSDKNSAPKLVETRTGKKFSLEQDLELCVNKILRGKYSFDLARRKISKVGTKDVVPITEATLNNVEEFMKDVCSVVKMGKMMTKERDPSIATFHITSLSLLEKQLTQEQLALVQDIWEIAYDKFVANIMARFSPNELSGQVSYVKPSETLRTRLLQAGKSQSRILANDPTPPTPVVPKWDQVSFQKGVWFTVAFIFVMFFAVMTLVTMDFQKDTLLYAKFLTTDSR